MAADQASHSHLSRSAQSFVGLIHVSDSYVFSAIQPLADSVTGLSRSGGCQASASAISQSHPGPATLTQSAPQILQDHHEWGKNKMTMRNVGECTACEEKDARQPAPSGDSGNLVEENHTSCPKHVRSCFVRILTTVTLANLPNELLLHILGLLDVPDLLATSRTSHQLRSLALAPILHRLRLRHVRTILPPLLTSPTRPSLSDLIHSSIFLTRTTVISRKLARSLTAIRLSRRLAVRPDPEALVARSVLPPECVPGQERVAPALVAKKRAVEREQVRDGLRRWLGSVWEHKWREKAEDRRRRDERSGVGRVWRLRRYWERVGRGEKIRSPLFDV